MSSIVVHESCISINVVYMLQGGSGISNEWGGNVLKLKRVELKKFTPLRLIFPGVGVDMNYSETCVRTDMKKIS